MRRYPAYHGLKALLGIRGRDIASGRADGEVVDRIVAMVDGPSSGGIDAAVLLALDGVFRPGASEMDREATSLYVPNDYLFSVCQRSKRLLAGASVHPDRPNAIDALERAVDRGAVLNKWLPPAQRIDPGDPRHIPFYERMVAHGLPLLCHTSVEKTFPTESGQLDSPALLRLPLEVGVTVIAAHCAAGVVLSPGSDYVDELVGLMEEFPNLYADNGALCSPGRGHHWSRLLRKPLLCERMLHGSDYPVPVWPLLYAPRLGLRRARQLHAIDNALLRDAQTKRAVGVPNAVFGRATSILRAPAPEALRPE